jgi:Holliday junction DNA helicase RuvA
VIGSLRGRVIDRGPTADRSATAEVILEVAGVGYRVAVTVGTLEGLRLGDEAMLHIHHHIREADQRLYGFSGKEERVAFEGLLAAHGVGPALAMAVLATHPSHRLARILAEDDLQALCEVPGVGRKTAQRLLVELRSSLVLPDLAGVGAGAGAIDLNGSAPGPPTPVDDVREALVNLGYSGEEVRVALASLPTGPDDRGLDAGQLLKLALRALAGG